MMKQLDEVRAKFQNLPAPAEARLAEQLKAGAQEFAAERAALKAQTRQLAGAFHELKAAWRVLMAALKGA